MTSFSSIPVKDIAAPSSLTTIDSSSSFRDAFQKLINNNLLSAPVWCAKENAFVGYLELRDLLSIVVSMQNEDSSLSSLDALLDSAKQTLLGTDGVTLTYLARRHPFRSVADSASMGDVLAVLGQHGGNRLRRVAVVNDKKELVNVISASRAVALLADRWDDEKDWGELSVADAKLGTSPVFAANDTDMAIDVFSQLDSKGHSGAAIVREGTGQLCGHVSARDLKKFIQTAAFDQLQQPIAKFLSALRAEAVDIRVPTILSFPNTPLKTVVQKMNATKVHRIYVVDSEESMKPESVISVGDIAKWMATL